jgi:hypothetical protein
MVYIESIMVFSFDMGYIGSEKANSPLPLAGPRENEPSCGSRFDQFFIFQKLVTRLTIPFSFSFLENSCKSL